MIALYANRALARIRLRKWALAEEDCLKVLSMDPNHAKAHARLGRVKFENGDLEGADACYNRAEAIRPDLTEIKSRWRVDLALSKQAGTQPTEKTLKALKQSQAGMALGQLELREQERELSPYWKGLKPNRAYLRNVFDGKDSVLLAEVAMQEASEASEVDLAAEAQRTYEIGVMINDEND